MSIQALSCRFSRWALLGIVIVLATLDLSFPEDAAEEDAAESWKEMEADLRVLWTGTPDEKGAVAQKAYFEFFPLFEPDEGRHAEDKAKVLASLRSFVGAEKDDFISYRLLNELADHDEDELTPLFLDALHSRSPNLRASAFHWFSEHTSPEALPELQYSWRHEDRPWARADLMIALVRHGSREEAADFPGLARGKSGSLATAAIRALTLIGDPAAIPFLATIVRTSRSNPGLLALDALARWPDSRDALDATLEASRSPRVDLERHAAGILGRFDDPAAATRAREMTAAGVDPDVRAAALGALARSMNVDVPDLARIALGILWEAPTGDNAPAQSAAVATLRDLDDPSILPQLTGIEFSPQDSRFRELGWLKARLGRPREEPAKDASADAEAHPGRETDFILPEDEPESFRIAPAPPMLTVRCWQAPDVPGEPGSHPRLGAGLVVKVRDHFERVHESWVQIDLKDCWVPLRFIESAAANASSNKWGRKENTMIIRREFDLPAAEVESDVSQGLMDAGLLEVIEPGDEVIGVAISIDAEDFDRVLLLARSCGLNETMLDGEIYEIVADLAPLYRGHPVLDRFRRPPQVKGATTDEVIDLDLDETTDE